MKKIFTLISFFAFVQLAIAQTPTWAQDIAPIMYKNCTSCHHKGGLGPTSYITYASTVSKADSIDITAVNRIMPPWSPDPSYNRLAHERVLAQSDINKIHAWVMGGVPMGDTAHAPTPPVYDNTSALGTVDLTLKIPTYKVPGNQTSDIYQCFALPTSLLQDKYITAMEVIPGNAAIVHHVLVYEDTTGQALQLQQQSVNNNTGPGYLDFGGIGVNGAPLLGGWVPGSMPNVFPPDFGVKLSAGATIVLQIHYPNGSNNRSDSTVINFKLADNVSRQVTMAPILNHYTNINAPLDIPANTVQTFTEHYHLSVPVDISLLTVGPHSHLLGRKWISFAVTPTNDTMPFIRINQWDFRWQGFYPFRNIVKLPAHSDLYAQCTYDNTTANPDNPTSPPKEVVLGESTTDEMMLVYFSYLVYETGDENIVQDTSQLVNINDVASTTPVNEVGSIVSTPQLYDASPNPATGQTLLSYYLPSSAITEIKIFNLSGQLIETITAPGTTGFNYYNLNTAHLSSGTYLYSLNSGGYIRTKQLVITN